MRLSRGAESVLAALLSAGLIAAGAMLEGAVEARHAPRYPGPRESVGYEDDSWSEWTHRTPVRLVEDDAGIPCEDGEGETCL